MRGTLPALLAVLAACSSAGRPADSAPAKDVVPSESAAGVVEDASRGSGDGVVVLLAVDEAAGKPTPARVRLWRLGAPGDAFWTQGDHVQRDVELAAEAARIEGLPWGRYRVEVKGQRAGFVDPAEVVVGGGERRIEFRVLAPRKFHVRLVAVDEEGRRLDHGRLAYATVSGGNREDVPPFWAHPRARVDGKDAPQGRYLHACGHGVFYRDGLRRTDVVADERGFDLGEFVEDSREMTSHDEALVEFDGRASAVVSIRGDLHQDATYYVVAPRIEAVFANVRRPDGWRVDLSKAMRVRADCRNDQSAAMSGGTWWSGLAVDACFQTAGYETLLFTWRMATADEKYVLKPGEPR